MKVLGVVFVGSSTPHRSEMGTFVREVLGLEPLERPDIEADVFATGDGGSFAVAWPGTMGPTERSIGFLVDDLDAATAELQAAGVSVDAVATNATERYVHFVAPDGHCYELIERPALA